MGKVRQFCIVLSSSYNNKEVFEAGTLLEGYVKVDFAERCIIESIALSLDGNCKVKWGTGGDGEKIYRAEQLYIQEVLYFFKADRQEVESGVHKFPFNVRLPDTLPSSFEGEHGYVRYTCKALMTRPWKLNKTNKKRFTVIRNMDLNDHTFDNYFLPVSSVNGKEITCSCFGGSGFVDATFTLQKRCFVPGENVIFEVEINNGTGSTIRDANIRLYQVVTYSGMSGAVFSSGLPKPYTVTKKVGVLHLSIVFPNCVYKSGKQGIQVPSVPPSKLVGCMWINIHYYIRLHVSSVKIDYEVLIATIPRQRCVRQRYVEEAVYSHVEDEISPSYHSVEQHTASVSNDDPPPAYSDITSLPSYEECVIKVPTDAFCDDTETDQGQLNSFQEIFIPAYPCYHNADFATHLTDME